MTTGSEKQGYRPRTIAQLKRLSRQRQAELRKASAPWLRYPNEHKSVIAIHVEDAQMGLVPLRHSRSTAIKLPRHL